MADMNVSYTVGFEGDFSKLHKGTDTFANSLKQKPLVVPVDLGTVDTSQTEKFRDAVKQQAVGLDEIITKSKVIQNIKTGEQTRIATEQTRKWTDALGATFVETTKLDGAFQNIGKEFRTIGEETSTQKVTSQVQKLGKEWETADKTIQGMSNSAEKFLAKSENMTGKQVEGARQTANALVEVTKQWNTAYGEKNEEQLKRLKVELEKLNKEFGIQEASTRRGAGALRGWAENITNAWKQTISYTFSLGSVRLAQQAFNQALRYTIDLNKEMVNIQILQAEGAQTPEEINSLAQSFNSLGKELGATTLEIAKGSVEWLRQGKTIEETQELLRASTMLSKLGNVEAAESTEYLTSTINSFKMEAEDAVSIVDKLVAVDNIAATSTKELATALRYVAAVAGETGVSLEQLISYIGVISSTTRLNAESIGQAMKTMLTRMQDIRAGKIDEDGLGINNVAIALERVDIALMESETEFRDFGAVLEELAGKWDTLNEVEQANISKAIAGVRQANMFTILMTNMGDALKYQEEQLNASGLAMDRYGIYMESVEAKQNQLKASVEGLYQDAIKDGLIQSLLDAGIKIIDFIDDIGGIELALQGLSAVLVVLAISKIPAFIAGITGVLTSIGALTGVITGASVATGGLAATVAAATGGLSLLIPIVIGLVAAINYANKAHERHIEALKEANDEYKKSIDNVRSLNRERETVVALWKDYEDLAKKKKEAGLTEEESQKLIDVQNQLHTILPEIAGSYDDSLNFSISMKVTQAEILEIERERLEIAKEQARVSAQTAAEAAVVVQVDKEEELNKLLEDQARIRRQMERDINSSIRTGAQIGLSADEINENVKNIKEMYKIQLEEVENGIDAKNKEIIKNERDFKNFYKMLGAEQGEEWIAGLDTASMTPVVQKWINELRTEFAAQAADALQIGLMESENAAAGSFTKGLTPSAEQYAAMLETVKANLIALDEALDNLRENNAVDDQVSFLKGLGIEVDFVGDKWVVAQDSVDEYKGSVADAASAGYDLTETMNRGLDSVVDSFTNVVNGISLTKSQFTTYTSNMGQAIWNLAESSGAALTDSKNRALTSAQAIATAMLTNQATYNSLIVQMTKASAGELAKLAEFASGLLLSIKNFGSIPTMPTFGGGSSGGGSGTKEKTPEELEKERLQEEIKGWEKEKKLWKDKLDAFKKYIKAQKESLKLKKEEKDFNRELAEKSKDLAELQAEIALLALDNSEEARARRLELEQEAADLEVEIAKDKEDRKYEVQVNALEQAEQEYEDYVNGQIAQFDALIEKNNELIEALDKLIASMTGSGGSGGGFPAAGETIDQIIKKLESLGISVDGLTISQILNLNALIKKWDEMGWSVERYLRLLQAAAEAARNNYSLDSLNQIAGDIYKEQHGNQPGRTMPTMHHQGGLVESHHNGDFAGGLRSNEVFSKLLKGEYVATENQMSNFMKNILPKIASEMPTQSKSGAPVISINMPITVEGNLDKSVIPDLEKITDRVIKNINTSLKQRGYVRQTTLTGYV